MVIGLSGVQFGMQSYFVITSAITDQIGLHEVLLPLLIKINLANHMFLLPINCKNYNFREEKYSQVIKERENLH